MSFSFYEVLSHPKLLETIFLKDIELVFRKTIWTTYFVFLL